MAATTALLLSLALAAGLDDIEPAADAVEFGPARFSIISPSLLRLELGSGSVWDERPTLSYPGGRKRASAAVHHTVSHPSNSSLVLSTDELVLRYDRSVDDGAFTARSLSITLTADGTVWHPGDVDTGNLRGSRLDVGCYATFESCYSNGLSPGPLSKAGWALMDDSVGVRMETENNPVVGFPWYSSAYPCDAETGICGPSTSDWYFFGHGHRYREAMRDFALVSGRASLPPRVAFGVWWSTWYNFTSYELTHTVLDGYKEHGLPLDVVVMDMEWHTVTAPSFRKCSRSLCVEEEG